MNNTKNGSKEKLHHIVVPFSDVLKSDMAEDGLFDDCPLCQQMREDAEKGLIDIYEGEVDLEEEEAP